MANESIKEVVVNGNTYLIEADTSEIKDQLTAEDDLQFQFSKSGSNYGYKDANGNFVPFKNPTGTKSITANGTYDVTDYASAKVNVSGWKYAIWYNGYVTSASRGAIYDSTVPILKSGPSGSTPPEDLLNSAFVTKATPDYYGWGQYAWAVTVKKSCKLRNNTSGVVSSISTGTTLKFGYRNTYNGDYTLYFE